MPSINDFFGKASIDNNYAIATTVKTVRTSGATVLEAFDLSKFSDSTPVFFVTYKKTTDPVTNVTSVVDLVSWKGLVNTGANTITNLTLAPGYTDIGNDVGDFVESIPTSLWNKDLIDGILVSHNQDGTLKDGAITPAVQIFSGSLVEGNSTALSKPASQFSSVAIRLGSFATYIVCPVIPSLTSCRGTNTFIGTDLGLFEVFGFNGTFNSAKTQLTYLRGGSQEYRTDNTITMHQDGPNVTEVWGLI